MEVMKCLVLLPLMLLLQPVTGAPPMAKPNGTDHCRDVLIPWHFGMDPLLIIPITLGGAVGVVAVLFRIRLAYKMIKRRRNRELRKKFFIRNGGLLLQQQLSSANRNLHRTGIFEYKELETATDHFNRNRIIGNGCYCTVYKGMLADGRIVAVKKSTLVDEEKVHEFINEVVIHSQINHRNVVKLLGWCLDTQDPLLVYEFIPNGFLCQHLHYQNEGTLSWEMRLQIATEVSGAIAYLHSGAEIPVYHRDIKSTNILLDGEFRAKLSGFGSSRSTAVDQTHLSTHVQGTFGYLDPEYFQSGQFTEKSDVYSFGVVLVELFSGRKPTFSEESEETSLSTCVKHFMEEEKKLGEIIDPAIMQHNHEQQIKEVADLARRCLSTSGRFRPTMKEVAMELERIRSSSKRQLSSQESIELSAIPTLDRSDFSNLSCQSYEDNEP